MPLPDEKIAELILTALFTATAMVRWPDEPKLAAERGHKAAIEVLKRVPLK